MNARRKRKFLFLLSLLLLLPILAFSVWYGRQVRQRRFDYALIEAIKKNDAKKAIALLNEGADANAVDKPYQPKTFWSMLQELWNRSKTNQTVEENGSFPSALMMTIWSYSSENDTDMPEDNTALIRVLLEHGANPNIRNEDGLTPLMETCHYHRLETSQALLEHGANPNAKSPVGITPLMMACKGQDAKTVSCLRLLIEHGAEVNTTDKMDQTALMFYVMSWELPSSVEPVRYLLKQGAKVSLSDTDDYTALDYARLKQKKALLPLLEEATKKEEAHQAKEAKR